MRGLKPGDKSRPIRRINFAKAHEGGHLVSIAPPRALHVLKPAHQRVAGDLEEARRLSESQEGCVKKVVAGRLIMPANQIGKIEETGRHTQWRACRRDLGRFLLREKVVLLLRASRHKADCFCPSSARRG